MNRHFIDPGPYTFQLQQGYTGLQDADDWVDIGTPVLNTYYAYDLSQHVWGKDQDTHYRLQLTTPEDVYYSMPAGCDGHLSKRDWLKAREIIRKESLRHRVLVSPEGFLLKARRYGPRCATCGDSYTEEVSNSHCPACYGTGYANGYFEPLPACFADVGLHDSYPQRAADRGMVHEHKISGRFIGDPALYTYDVWVNRSTDERYYLHNVKSISQVRGVPIVFDVELCLAPYTDVVYTVPIDKDFGIALPVQQGKKVAAPCPQRKVKPSLNYLEAALAEVRRRKTRSSKR
jgi:hypothetical protein